MNQEFSQEYLLEGMKQDCQKYYVAAAESSSFIYRGVRIGGVYFGYVTGITHCLNISCFLSILGETSMKVKA